MYETNTLEIPSEEGDATEKKIIEIMEGKRKPKNHHEQQIFLATELFREHYPSLVFNPLDKDKREEIMNYWETKGYRDSFREIRTHSGYDADHILQGDPTKITLDHVGRWKFEQKLPGEE